MPGRLESQAHMHAGAYVHIRKQSGNFEEETHRSPGICGGHTPGDSL